MLTTPLRKQLEARNKKIRNTYARLLKRGAMATAAKTAVAQKFNVSETTVYNVTKGV
ncbi:hypothetical protein GO755_26610 [Spirosoma sp. HMF4905]|uniref:Helix-turn-helix domain-containing protein n=1 Tax=Spirosoma arboris TaxID=2682092 RepID=A0A7K1SIJ0_9BACT|nr:hypothetical protein [Spirosoma arboris]MVM33639.1 hypothetical protein [Spirosoma arboris]